MDGSVRWRFVLLAAGLVNLTTLSVAQTGGNIQPVPSVPTLALTNYVGPGEFTAGEHFTRHLHLPPTVRENFFDWQRGAIIPLALMGAGGIIWATGADKSIRHTFAHHPLGLGGIDDIGLYSLLGVSIVHGAGLSWLDPDKENGWREIEVLAETQLSTAGLVDLAIKPTVARERPDHSNNDSFPSGHAATAFASATYISRYWMRQYDDGRCSLAMPVTASVAGYGMATVVGLARMDNNRHWTSDVLVGGGIGMLLGQCLYALHFDERGVFRHSQWNVSTFDSGDASGLALAYHF